MASSVYFPNSRRGSTSLPSYSNSSSAVQEKLKLRTSSPWLIPVSLSIPGVKTRRLRLYLPNLRRLHASSVLCFGRKKGSAILLFGFLLLVFIAFALTKRFGSRSKKWPRPFIGDPPTLVFKHEDLRRIWKWEIASGHYPSRRPSELERIWMIIDL